MSLLEFQQISKSFSGVEVLHNVSFQLEKGKVIALIGENGAGKSTLMKILCGILNDYQGKILLNGNEIKFNNPREAENAGISIIHQELNLVNDLNVAENIYLGHEPINRIGFIDFNRMYIETKSLLAEFDFPFSVKTKVRDLPIGWQQMVEIAKALRLKAEIIVMDEPTSALSESEIQFLFKQIVLLKESGKTIVYISHRMKEIFEIADEVTVLRDGRYIGKYSVAEVDQNFLVKKMVGKEIKADSDKKRVVKDERLLHLRSVSVHEGNKKLLSDISFELKRGEVIGIAGLLGAGRTELLKFLYGAYDQKYTGEMEFKNMEFIPSSPSRSIQNRIVYLSEDRKSEGIFPELSNLKNSSISILPSLSDHGFIKNKAEIDTVTSMTKELNVRMESIHQHISHLSGGNQQKVLLSRVLLINPDLLLLDEPTRGIDVGAKQEIYDLIEKLKKEGLGILFTSSEIPELLLVSDRILVLSEGGQTALLDADKTDSREILKYAFGGAA
ncbi:Ribose ABC transport system, ATP-binding protein RbsA (TC 3.A.1.2.1) [hydrothermal vent metagenome]|uniref:Ribose ABC transport system, ATP-binding protein RbsA (TC 3.A.1.2.1) n=1 Tax=hydrothermal vent metagenome TaxID=652676 RepID=A0A3B1BC25_9ZZZZ